MITSGQFDFLLIKRCEDWMANVGMDVASQGGGTAPINNDLLDPKSRAILECGGSVANPTGVIADGDVASIPDANHLRLVDLAELFLLETILQQYNPVDASILMGRQNLDQWAKRLEKRIEAKRLYCQRRWSYGLDIVPIAVGQPATRIPVAGHTETYDPDSGAQVVPPTPIPLAAPAVPWGATSPFGEAEGFGP